MEKFIQPNKRNQLSRRSFLKFSGVGLFSALGALMAYFYIGNEFEDPTIEQVEIPIPQLPESFEGFRIVQISDIHYYPITTLALVDKAVQMTNQLDPDLVVLTGDYVWHDVEVIYEMMPALAKLNAKHGVFACLGNHDLWTDVQVVTQAFDEVKLPLLVNQGIPIRAGQDHIFLAGLDDGWSGQPDLEKAMDRWIAGAPTVLLMHEPDLAPRYAVDQRINLQLSGHSHGGQVRLPFLGALILPYLSWKYPIGLYDVNGMWLYTNRGLGTTNIPLRINCAPEITELRLVSA
jgi:predicted MPP superfamily phosphohydrolase